MQSWGGGRCDVPIGFAFFILFLFGSTWHSSGQIHALLTGWSLGPPPLPLSLCLFSLVGAAGGVHGDLLAGLVAAHRQLRRGGVHPREQLELRQHGGPDRSQQLHDCDLLPRGTALSNQPAANGVAVPAGRARLCGCSHRNKDLSGRPVLPGGLRLTPSTVLYGLGSALDGTPWRQHAAPTCPYNTAPYDPPNARIGRR